MSEIIGNARKPIAVKKTKSSKKTPNKKGVKGANKHDAKEFRILNKIRIQEAKKRKKNKIRKKRRGLTTGSTSGLPEGLRVKGSFD